MRDVQATPIGGVKVQVDDEFVYTDKHGRYQMRIKENSYARFTKPNYKEQIIHVNSDIELNLRMIKE